MILVNDKAEPMGVTHDLFKSESSIKVIPQSLELHGLGMVPAKAVANEWT